MFDWKKPTVQMLGRWQPWHDGHQALFKRCIAKTGQVAIQVRDVQGASGGDGQDDNPFNWDEVCKNIEAGLLKMASKGGKSMKLCLCLTLLILLTVEELDTHLKKRYLIVQ
jgi:hypothetical protein